MKKIVVVGSLNMDLVATVAAMPQPGETITGRTFSMHAGGKGANQAFAAARLGGTVTMIGAVGRDSFGETLTANLRDAGIESGGIHIVDDPTGCAMILVDASGANQIVVTPGANAHLSPRRLADEGPRIEEAGVVLCQLETPLATVQRAAEIASAKGIPLILDPAPAPQAALPRELMQQVTYLTPNETETRALLHRLVGDHIDLDAADGVEAAAAAILAAGPRNVILKRGSSGAYIAGRDCAATFVPSPQVVPTDTTAAGDTFNGAFAFALMSGSTPVDAATFACAAAAVSVTRHGAQESMPTLAEVHHAMQ